MRVPACRQHSTRDPCPARAWQSGRPRPGPKFKSTPPLPSCLGAGRSGNLAEPASPAAGWCEDVGMGPAPRHGASTHGSAQSCRCMCLAWGWGEAWKKPRQPTAAGGASCRRQERKGSGPEAGSPGAPGLAGKRGLGGSRALTARSCGEQLDPTDRAAGPSRTRCAPRGGPRLRGGAGRRKEGGLRGSRPPCGHTTGSFSRAQNGFCSL